MRTRTTVAAVAAMCSVTACASRKVHVTTSPGESPPAATATTTTSPNPRSPNPTTVPATHWTAALAPQGGGSVSGDASVAPGNTSGTTVVIITVKGGTPGASYPWHLQSGQCGSNGSVVAAPDAYPPLTVGSDGTAKATATLPVPTPSTGSYDVIVDASPSDAATSISCGDLKGSGS